MTNPTPEEVLGARDRRIEAYLDALVNAADVTSTDREADQQAAQARAELAHPTPEQIEAAARAICGFHDDPKFWTTYEQEARAALAAAAGVTPQEPGEGSGDRKKLIESLKDALDLVVDDGQGYYSREVFVGTDIVREALAALAAPVQVDEAKLAEAMREVESVHQIHGVECLCGFKSSRSRSRTEHITQALAELLRGGGR